MLSGHVIGACTVALLKLPVTARLLGEHLSGVYLVNSSLYKHTRGANWEPGIVLGTGNRSIKVLTITMETGMCIENSL